MKFQAVIIFMAACGPSGSGGQVAGGGPDAAVRTGADAARTADAGSAGSASYTVYAHSDTTLYSIDLATKALVTVGSFATTDVMTDLAVAPNGTIYTVSEHYLFTASPVDGHVTKVASIATCGTQGVALTTTVDGRMWIGDYLGAICELDITQSPPVVKPPVMLGSGMALAGDMVGIADGTVFGTAYSLSDSTSVHDNTLVKLDPATGTITEVGATGFPRLYGAAFQEDRVFGFTHDGSGRVITIDLATGAGTLFGTFTDPATGMGIAFAGAGVNPMVTIE